MAKENQRLSEGKGCQKSDNLKVKPLDTKKELAKLADSVILAKRWLTSGSNTVKQFNSNSF